MEYRCKVTVIGKKLYPELQAEYCAVPDSGKCPCYNVGDEFLFYRNDERDDYWHMGEGTLIKAGDPELLAKTLRTVLADPVRSAAQGKAAAGRIREAFSLDASCRQYAETFRF